MPGLPSQGHGTQNGSGGTAQNSTERQDRMDKPECAVMPEEYKESSLFAAD